LASHAAPTAPTERGDGSGTLAPFDLADPSAVASAPSSLPRCVLAAMCWRATLGVQPIAMAQSIDEFAL
jgi:hypothetical protein